MDDVLALSPLVERALRVAAIAHQGQSRKASSVPYITHPVAVAMILQRHGFTSPEMLAAALLHDVVEDTSVTAHDLSEQFPAAVMQLVTALTETKLDASGAQRPWRDRKEDHLRVLSAATSEACTIALADKLHNLSSMLFDLDAGEDIWSRFNASMPEVLWYHQAMLAACDGGEPELQSLLAECRVLLNRLVTHIWVAARCGNLT